MRPQELRLIRLTLALVWLVTGALSLGIYPQAESLKLLGMVGLHGQPALAALYAGALLDIALGLLTLFLPRRWLWTLQMAVILGYTVIITVFLPHYWLHPFGPILKNLPILVLLWLLNRNEGHST